MHRFDSRSWRSGGAFKALETHFLNMNRLEISTDRRSEGTGWVVENRFVQGGSLEPP